MKSFPAGATAAVVGAAGGVGSALVAALRADPGFALVHAFARADLDLADEDSVRGAASRIVAPLHLLIVATGTLHGPGRSPEKTYRALDPANMVEAFRINTVGPALVAKHMLGLLPTQGRGVFAALSARVGSIGDNRSGGWHAYRASKAALNMILRNLAIETARRNPETICVGLHPGTVDTRLSAPFQRNVTEGKLFTPAFAASRLLEVIDGLEPSDTGHVLAWDGATVPP